MSTKPGQLHGLLKGLYGWADRPRVVDGCTPSLEVAVGVMWLCHSGR